MVGVGLLRFWIRGMGLGWGFTVLDWVLAYQIPPSLPPSLLSPSISPNTLIFSSHPIKQNEVPEVRVWAIPDEARKFKDDLIIMIKDNPTPVILPMTCLGSKPQIEIT